MPLREINAKFTKSDLAIMAWRSQEQSHQMHEKMKTPSAAARPMEPKKLEDMSSDEIIAQFAAKGQFFRTMGL